MLNDTNKIVIKLLKANMLISLNYLINKYNLKIKGVSHFGAHLGQEVNLYLDNKIQNIHLFEPQKFVYKKLYEKYKVYDHINFYKFGLGSENINVSMYLDTTKSESSSILKPKTHLDLYPDVGFEGTEKIEIKIYDELLIRNVNFLNLDIQGYELEALKGCSRSMKNIDYIYTEVNNEEVYEDCVQVSDLDRFLHNFEFIRVETNWYDDNLAWGDAFYIKKSLISKANYLKVKFFNFLLKSRILLYISFYFKLKFQQTRKLVFRFKQKVKSYIR